MDKRLVSFDYLSVVNLIVPLLSRDYLTRISYLLNESCWYILKESLEDALPCTASFKVRQTIFGDYFSQRTILMVFLFSKRMKECG
jgi:hypothetical protein